jgi:hypothetical protein
LNLVFAKVQKLEESSLRIFAAGFECQQLRYTLVTTHDYLR